MATAAADAYIVIVPGEVSVDAIPLWGRYIVEHLSRTYMVFLYVMSRDYHADFTEALVEDLLMRGVQNTRIQDVSAFRKRHGHLWERSLLIHITDYVKGAQFKAQGIHLHNYHIVASSQYLGGMRYLWYRLLLNKPGRVVVTSVGQPTPWYKQLWYALRGSLVMASIKAELTTPLRKSDFTRPVRRTRLPG